LCGFDATTGEKNAPATRVAGALTPVRKFPLVKIPPLKVRRELTQLL
jgi:hypothetical protein